MQQTQTSTNMVTQYKGHGSTSNMKSGIDEEPDDKIPSNDENFKKEKNFSQTSNYKDNQKLKTGDYYNPEYWLLLMIMSIIIFIMFNRENIRH